VRRRALLRSADQERTLGVWMRNLLMTLMLLCTLAPTTLGCASAKSKVRSEEPLKPPTDPWSWLPETSTTIGRVAVDALRGTQLWPLWTELEGEQKLASWVSVNKIARVTFGGTGQTRDEMSYVAALEGPFAEDELAQLAARDHVTAEVRGLLKVYARPEGYWTQLTPRLIVMCTPDRIDDLVARASQGDGTPVKQGALWKSLADRIFLETTQVGLLADDPDGSRRAMIDRQAARFGLGAFAKDANRLGLGIEVGAEYRVVAVAEAPDEERAVSTGEAVKKTIETVGSNFFVRMLGVTALLAKVRISNVDNYVFARAIISEVDFNEVVERVRSALTLANGAGSLGGLP
jgi:hypothetical protein